jgi:ketosteroid isomerase-like protein
VYTIRARHGKSGAGEFFQIMAEVEDTLKFEPREFVAHGGTVVVLGHYEDLAKCTGRQFETYFAQFFTVQDGKIMRFREFTDTAAQASAFMKTQTHNHTKIFYFLATASIR